MDIQEHIPLAPLTTFHIGGPARFFMRVKNVEELKQAFDFARDKNLTTFVLGGGSNVLVDDAGFDGLVVKVEIEGVEEKDDLLCAGAGESWDVLVIHAVKNGLWGIENLSGIPGTVGGAVVQNIGAYGQALSQTLEWVEVYDTLQSTVTKLTAKECQSGYRDSVFKHEPGRYIALRVALKLSQSGETNTSYKDLRARFADTKPALQDVRDAVLEIRKLKFPDLTVEGTAGSFFKNPILEEAEAQKLQKQFPTIPLFPMPETAGVKVPLAWLLDHALKLHGTKIGGARLFERQPLVIAAQRNTSANDVKKLAERVQEKVYNELNIAIEPEVTIL